jgi:hypothetical protein
MIDLFTGIPLVNAMQAIWSPAPEPAAPAAAETGGTDEAAMRAAIGGLGAAGRSSLAGAFEARTGAGEGGLFDELVNPFAGLFGDDEEEDAGGGGGLFSSWFGDDEGGGFGGGGSPFGGLFDDDTGPMASILRVLSPANDEDVPRPQMCRPPDDFAFDL